MTYTVERDGRNMGTYSEEGLARQLSNGVLLPTDRVLLEKEQRWALLSELPKGDDEQIAEFAQKLELATPNAILTPAIIAINVAVFLAMIVAGVSALQPSTADLIRWGADFGPLTTHGQWWRLLTAAFLHVGFLHIAFNMWALFAGGVFAERLFGKAAFLTLYLVSAIGGNLASVAAQPLIVAAGASGAIFGVYGAIFGFSIAQHKSIPPAALRSLRSNALVFVGYNIIYGFTAGSHIDIAAHLGGLLTGLVAGCALAYRVELSSGDARLRRSIVVMLAALLLFSPIAWKLRGGDDKKAEAYLTEANGKTLKIGKNDAIVYSGAVSADDAARLGRMLTATHFLQDRGTLVLYSRDAKASTVSLFFKEGALQDPKAVLVFNVFGIMISRTMNMPVKLRILDKQREVKLERVFDPANRALTSRTSRDYASALSE